MKNQIKKICFFLFVCAFCFSATKVYKRVSERFCLSNIRYEETNFYPRAFEIPENQEDLSSIKNILNQKFSYLGQGNQSYAFESADGQYVLKFFKFGHLKENRLLKNLSKITYLKNFLTKTQKAQEERFFKIFEGYYTAYTEDPENSALIFIHLNRTSHLKQSIQVRDNFLLWHEIDLDSVAFVLQEKVIPTREVLGNLLKNGDLNGAKEKIRQLFNLYVSQYKKGLYDRDHNLGYNTGFKGKKAIRLDVGKFRKEPLVKDPAFYKKDLEKIAFIRLKRFVSTYYPKYTEEICRSMEEDLKLIFNEHNL